MGPLSSDSLVEHDDFPKKLHEGTLFGQGEALATLGARLGNPGVVLLTVLYRGVVLFARFS